MQRELRIDLDWRGGPQAACMPTREIVIAKLHSLLTQIDAEGNLKIEVANTRSQKSVVLQDVGHGLPGQKTLVRYTKPINKILANNIVSHLCTSTCA